MSTQNPLLIISISFTVFMYKWKRKRDHDCIVLSLLLLLQKIKCLLDKMACCGYNHILVNNKAASRTIYEGSQPLIVLVLGMIMWYVWSRKHLFTEILPAGSLAWVAGQEIWWVIHLYRKCIIVNVLSCPFCCMTTEQGFVSFIPGVSGSCAVWLCSNTPGFTSELITMFSECAWGTVTLLDTTDTNWVSLQ